MQPIYFLDINAEACSFNVKVNDFPVFSFNAQFLSNPAQSINQFLIGKKNKVEIKILPVLISDDDESRLDALSRIRFEGRVKVYQPGDVSSPEGGVVISEFNFDGLTGGLIHFDSELHNFSSLLTGNEIAVDNNLLKLYGIRLFDLCLRQDADSLTEEFIPKMIDYSKAYFQEEEILISGFKSFLENNFFVFPIERKEIVSEDILIRPCCNKRIFEILILPNDPLLSSYSTEDRSMIYEIPIFVSIVNGQFKVVR